MRKKKIIKAFSRVIVFIFAVTTILSTIPNFNEVKAESKTIGVNLALKKDVTVSGLEIEGQWNGDKAVDGDYTSDSSRWASAEVTNENPQWIEVDLGQEYVVEQINIRWQAFAYGTEFKVQKSNDGETWTDIESLTNPVGKDEANRDLVNVVNGNEEEARYIRIYITKRNSWTCVSIRELEVIGYELREGNIAFKKDVHVSAVENNSSVWTGDKAVDGIKDTDDSRWATPTISVPAGENDKHTLIIDFEKEVEIDSMNMYWYKKAFASDYEIQKSNDGETWVNIKEVKNPSGETMNKVDTISFDSVVKARYLRVYINERNANAYNNVSIREIEVMGREKVIPDEDLTASDIIGRITSIENPSVNDTEITLPVVPQGFSIRVHGSEFKNILDLNGNISPWNINDATFSVILEVYNLEDEADKATKSFNITVPGKTELYPEIFPVVENPNTIPSVIPSLQEWYGYEGEFTLTNNSRILINSANNVDLNKVAQLFNRDLLDFTGMELQVIEVESEADIQAGDIYIETLMEDSYNLGEEGYLTKVEDSIKIYAPTYTGSLYGTITLLQILWQSEGSNSIPCGVIRDYPKYEIRGAMLDVARMPMSMEFLEDYAKILSWYKMNEYHLHLNDNQWASPGENFKDPAAWDDVYSAFRLESKNHPGLKPKNSDLNDPYYTQEEYINLQNLSSDYGLEVVSEIDTPAHSLPFTKYKMDIGEPIHSTKYWFDHIDVESEEGMAFIKELFDEFLNKENPIFLGDTVHIGIDEYDTSVGDKFRRYAAELSRYMLDNGKTPRVWGSLKPFGGSTMLPEGTVIDLWSTSWEDPIAIINEGYDIINVPQPYTYITPSRWHKDFMNTQNIYNNWEPNVFGGVTLPLGEPQLLGGKMAIWGDESMEGIVEMDLHERLLPAVATVAEKTWGGTKDDKDYVEFMKNFNALEEGPNTTIEREIESIDENVVKYDFNDSTAKDSSSNGYNGTINNGEIVNRIDNDKALSFNGNTVLETPLKALVYPYTAAIDVKATLGEEMYLFSGQDGELRVKADGTLSLRRSFYEQDFNYRLPEGEWTNLAIVGTFQATALYVNGKFVEQLHTFRDHNNNILSGQEHHGTFVLPLEKIGEGFNGEIDNIEVYNTAMPEEWIAGDKAARVNLACGADAYSSSNEYLYTKEWRAVDGDVRNGDSKWSSGNSDNQWLLIDLLEVEELTEVKLNFFEAPTEYRILTSVDGVNFEEVGHINNNTSPENTITFDTKEARYIKFQGVRRGSGKPYRILEVSAFGEEKEAPKTLDFNGDGVINIIDLAIASKNYGKNIPEYDIDNDGIVNEYEINLILEEILK